MSVIDEVKKMNVNEEGEILELLNVGGEMKVTEEEILVEQDVIGN